MSLFHDRRHREPEPSGYDTAQVCLNGHVVNSYHKRFFEDNEAYCSQCGAKTITQCPECDAEIRGGMLGLYHGLGEPPAYCHACGEEYPWTRARLEAARDLIALQEELSDEEKEGLLDSLRHLVTDTPWTEVAAAKWKVLRPRISQALWDIVVKLMTEGAKQAIQ